MISFKQIVYILILSVIFPHQLFAVTFSINSCPATNDLFDHMSEQIDNRISGVTANNSSKKLFTTTSGFTPPWIINHDIWTENIIPVDFTGLSTLNSNSGYNKAGTLITPRHIVLADHYTLNIGNIVLFIAPEGTLITRIVTDVQNVPSTDISIAKLDSDVPENITHYPILDKTIFEAYLNDGFNMSTKNLPMVVFDQEKNAIVKDIGKNFIYDTKVRHVQSSSTQRASFNENIIDGDSGNPGFVLIGDKPVLMLTHYTGVHGPSYSYYRQEVQDVIDSMGGEHQLSTIDLSCFNAPIVLENNTDLTAVINAGVGTTVGTIGVKYNIENETPYFSFLSGNNDGALAINSATGEITVASSTLMTSFNFPRNIEVAVEENGPGGRMSKGTYFINMSGYPYYMVSDYSFSINEHSNINTLIGSVVAYDNQSNALSYSIISGNDNGIFSINPSIGQIRVASSTLLNHETNTSHSLVIRARESLTLDQLYKDINVNIFIDDVNYRFASSSYSFQINELDENDEVVGTISASIVDTVDVSSVYYEIIGGNSDSIFSINSLTGQIRIADNELLDGNDIYNLVVGIKDSSEGDFLTSTPVTIIVLKNDRPTISFERQVQSLIAYNVQEGSSVNMTFQLSAPYTKTIIANLIQTLGSAILNTDYILSSDTLTFLPGEISKVITFSALSDSVNENLESVLFNIGDYLRVSFGPRLNATVNVNNKAAVTSSDGGGGGGGGFTYTPPTSTASTTTTQNQINTSTTISNIISTVNNNTPANIQIITDISNNLRDLKQNTRGNDVKLLQKFLNSQNFKVASVGAGSPGKETTLFGPATKKALIKFQVANNIKPSVGYFGPTTKAFIKSLLNTN